ncbi:MAG: carboxypeptidase-like regulatory domain-containing protein [Bacteroidota bacterium]
MKPFFKLLLYTLWFLPIGVLAQTQNLSGRVTDDKGQALNGATVFIGGSDRVTQADENGLFKFASVPQGTFKLSAQMLGYESLTENIIVSNAPVKVEFKLQPKYIALAKVTIGKRSKTDANLELFKQTFLGTSDNARQCVILNPQVINFSTKKNLLLADADQFLIIDNHRLGYRIHYLLQDFGYNKAEDIALYHGEFSFEEMQGTDEQKSQWAKNRLQTYQGSFMHFLRSVYANNTLENGFITRPMYGYKRLKVDDVTIDPDMAVIKDRLVQFDSLITVIDTGFVSFKFRMLYVNYAPEKAGAFALNKSDKKKNKYSDSKTSILKLSTEQAIIDEKGSHTDYRDFYIHGNWATARVGDQLPVEYKPPVPDIPRGSMPANPLVVSLQKWTDSIPQEKVYLHMDKPYYALGDTIWFKGYVTTGASHQLSALSSAVYVDLINERDSVVKDLKLPVTAGTLTGNFILGDEYTEGNYRIRAYTQWMRNAGPDYFFDHTFTVGDIGNSNVVASADYRYKDINGQQVLTALLNFTNDEGKAFAGQDVRYQIVVDKKTVWTQNVKTDALGGISININNDKRADLAGAYIRTTFDGADKYPVVRNFPIKAALSQSDVQFFPEGGNLVNGSASQIAFKAVGIDGLGVNIKGKIIDNENKEVADIETLYAGMGSFMLRPEAGKTYKANVAFADGTNKTINLPKAADEGYTLSVYQPNKDSVLVKINASTSLLKIPAYLIGQTNGDIVYASPVKAGMIWLDKKEFLTGIAQFTLFNINGEPLCERIIFIKNNDQMRLGLKTDKATYVSKQKVQLELDAKDSEGKPSFGNFSVSVIDESKLPVNENKESTIFSNILLKSDLKGYVEQPNYYFTRDSHEVNKALDNLMLTQGYRRFTWTELSNTVNTKPAFNAEGQGTNFAGKVTTLTNKLLANATVNMLIPKANIARVTNTDALGNFSFNGFVLKDSNRVIIAAHNKNSDKVKLILDSVPALRVSKNPNLGDVSTNIAQSIKTYIDNGKKLDDIYEKAGQLDKVQRLKEVRIRAKKMPPIQTSYGIQVRDVSVDHSYVIKDAAKCANLGMCLRGNLPGVVFKQYVVKVAISPGDSVEYEFFNYPFCRLVSGLSPIKVIVDGIQIRDRLDIGNVLKVDVAITNRAIVDMIGGPAILITTRRGMPRKSVNPSLANLNPKGFNKVRDFYHPKYEKPENTTIFPDLRSTIYWNPYVKTDENGRAKLEFFNADGPGIYRAVIEGINAAGELGRQVYRYKVE